MTYPLEGANLWAYGHSYIGGDYNGQTTQQRYPYRVARRLGMVQTNRGLPGAWAQDIVLDAIGATNPVRNWAFGSPGVVLFDGATNDIKDAGEHYQALRGFESAVRAFVHYVSLSSKVEDDSGMIGKVGCAVQPITDFSAGHNVFGPAGSYTEVGWYVNGPTRQCIGVAGIDGTKGGVFDVILDGAQVATFQTKLMCLNSAKGNPYTPIVIPIDIPAGSGHNVRIRSLAPYGEGPYFDFLGSYSPTPPLVALVKPVYLPTATYAAYPGRASDFIVNKYADILDMVAAGLSNVMTIDPREGWNPYTMIGSDGLHPNARGNDHLATVVSEAIDGMVQNFSVGITR